MKFFTIAATFAFSLFLVEAAPAPDSVAGIFGTNAAFQVAFTGAQLYSEKKSKDWFGTIESAKMESEALKDKKIFEKLAIDPQARQELKALILEQPQTIHEIKSVNDQHVLGDIPTPQMI